MYHYITLREGDPMSRARRSRFTLLVRLVLFLIAFGASLLVQMGVSRYQSQYVLEPMEERTEKIQTISRFLSGVESCMAELDDYRWDYGNAEALIAAMEASLSDMAERSAAIRSEVSEVGERYYLLASAARTTCGTLTGQLREIGAHLAADRTAEAAQLYYEQALPCGTYLLQYTRQLLERAILDNNETYASLNTLNVRLKHLQTVIAAVSVVLAVFMVASLASLLRSVVQMTRASMQISEGRLDIPDVAEGGDEIGQMAKVFNEMKRSMRQRVELLNRNNEMERELHVKETEALALQNLIEREKLQQLRSQINPHFLFNTLNVIMYTARQEGAEETRKLLDSLSRTFRYVLGSNDAEVPLSREIQIVDAFYSLYHARFADRLVLEWHIPPELELTEAMVPSFIIQPLVENAFNHGLARKEDGGRVDVYLKEAPETLLVRVTDNGAGMSEEALTQLREHLNDPPAAGDHIGLHNVAARLRLCGEQYGLEIQSTEGSGTEVVIRAPMRFAQGGDETD